MAKFDLIAVGAAGIDIFLDIRGKTNSLKFNKSSSELSIKLGDKILLDGYKFSCGQNGANVAVGSSRLGLKTALFAEVGDDDFAKRIIENLEKENVSTSKIKIEKGDSAFSVVVNFQNERTIFVENIKRNHNFDFKNVSADFLYLTSLSQNWINAYLETMSFIGSNNIPFAFNPGTTQIEDKDKVIFEIIKKSKILFLNKEEAETLLGKKRSFTQLSEKSYIKNLLTEFKKIGASIVVITDAQNGSYCADEKGRFLHIHGYAPNILEKTGAGDAYATGFVFGFLKGMDTPTAMTYGAINAAAVMEQIGGEEGLVTSVILKERAQRLENLKPILF